MRPAYRLVPSTDYALLRRLHFEIFPGDPLPELHCNWWLALDAENNPVGFCAVRESVQFTNAVFLTRAGVKECARGHGLQRRMIRLRTAWAKREGYQYALTYTVLDNFESMANLLKSGFRMYTPKLPYAGKAMYFCKTL